MRTWVLANTVTEACKKHSPVMLNSIYFQLTDAVPQTVVRP